jgi:glycogen phosphorylase
LLKIRHHNLTSLEPTLPSSRIDNFTKSLITPHPFERRARIDERLLTTIGVGANNVSKTDLMLATAQVAREQLSRRWVATQAEQHANKARRVVYLSMEFLIGRTLSNAISALDIGEEASQAIQQHANTLEDVASLEPDAGLGNGGLGRLAACFLDSMATLGLPSFGYGIRYEYGMERLGNFRVRASTFRCALVDG